MVRIMWLLVVSGKGRDTRRPHLRKLVVEELDGVRNLLYSGRPFDSGLPDHNETIKLAGRTHADRTRLMTLGGLLPRPIPFLGTLRLRIPWDLLTGRYDLVVTQTFSSAQTLATFFLGHLIRRKPYIVTSEHWYRRQNTLVNLWYRTVTRRAKFVVAQSSKSARFIVDELGVPADRVVKCINTIRSIDRYPYNEALAASLQRDRFTNVVCVARFKAVKGQHRLISAFRDIAREDARLHLVGDHDSEYGRECRELADGDSRVLFHGPRPFEDVLAFYRGGDLFVLANEFVDAPVEAAESFGYAPLEAAYLGQPLLLTTATGAADDLVISGETGYQIEAGDGEALRRVLSDLLADPRRLLTMGRAAQRHVRRLCSQQTVSELHGRLMQTVSELKK